MQKESLAIRDTAPTAHLFTSSKSRWKKMRTIMNPTFSVSKLREVDLILNQWSVIIFE